MTDTALSLVEPSLATPLDPEPKRKRKRRQAYPESERIIALMVVSLGRRPEQPSHS